MVKTVGNNQKRFKKGFTLIEVTLFLAITVALFFPLIIGTSTSIARQRYQDSVNDTYSYLQSSYSEVENLINANKGDESRKTCTIAASIADAESTRRTNSSTGLVSMDPDDLSFGRSNCAIYGKIFFFLPTDDTTYSDTGQTTHAIVSYDVLGDIYKYGNDLSEENTDILSVLRAVHADYLACENNSIAPAGAEGYHSFQWDSTLETVSPDHVPFQGALLIVRSPLNGAINSFFLNTDGVSGSNNIVTALKSIRENNASSCSVGNGSIANRASLYEYLDSSHDPAFKTNQEDAASICVASPDMFAYGGGSSSRRNIQIDTAIPASSRDVKLLNQDDGENQCE